MHIWFSNEKKETLDLLKPPKNLLNISPIEAPKHRRFSSEEEKGKPKTPMTKHNPNDQPQWLKCFKKFNPKEKLLIWLEAIHLSKQLVHCLLSLVVASTVATVAPFRDFLGGMIREFRFFLLFFLSVTVETELNIL